MSWLLIKLVRLYQLALSPLFANSCRFQPSCSRYAIDAIRLHGPLRGCYLAFRRILSCHPWGSCGIDPVPLPKTTCDKSKN